MRMANPNICLAMCVFLLATACTAVGQTIFVDADASGANNGTSWVDAYNYLQDGLAAAWSGDEIWVSQGMYTPDQGVGITPGDREATFRLINGVAIKGGYAGFGQPDPNARDIEVYETVLSGDLLGNDGPDFANNGENSYHVVTGSGTDATAVLDGFTITGGNAGGSSDMICHWKFDEGQGSVAYDSAGDNHGTIYGAQWTPGKIGTSLDFYGPGRYVTINPAALSLLAGGSEVTVALWQYGDIYQPMETTAFHATYSSNTVHRVILAHIAWWGTVYWDTVNADNWDRLSKPAQSHEYTGRWNHWTFTKDASAGEMKIYLNGSLWASATGKHNLLAKAVIFKIGSDINGQYNYGGLIDDMRIYKRALSAEEIQRLFSMGEDMDEDRKYGGGMYNDSGRATITNCIFSGNRAEERGGGMCNWENSSPTITNCTFTDNSAMTYGGGMCNGESSPTVTNCTFSTNSANRGGGIYNYYSSAKLTNCILWGNSDSGGMDESAQISGPAILNYCCIQGYVEPNEPPTQGMISYWKFDEGEGSIAYDSAGNKDGTIYGAEWTIGQIDGALDFDGQDDYVEVPGLTNPVNMTYALWVKADSLRGSWNTLIEFENDNPYFGVLSTGQIDLYMHVTTTATISTDEWYHIAVTSDGSQSVIYIDGQRDVTTGTANTATGTGMGIGYHSGDTYFDGIIDDVRIYERALSAEEIRQLYLCGTGGNQGNISVDPRFGVPGSWALIQSMDSHWKFDGNAYDSAGGNQGTVYGNPVWTIGQLGGALDLDGAGDYVNCGNDSSLNLTNNFSISAWLNLDSAGPEMLLCKGNVPAYFPGGAYTIICVPSNGTLSFYVRDSNNTEFGCAVTAVAINEWTHIVGTFNDGNISIYQNGIFVESTGLGTATIYSNNGPLGIGAEGDGGMPFRGAIDEVAIHNSALSDEEIQQLYQIGLSGHSYYHLLPDSPCINAGDPNYIAEPNETDLDGLPRVIGGRIDMGAYEYPNTAPIADAGDDQIVECACNTQQGTKVTLDGSSSSDSDSKPGTNDDIVCFDWFKIDPCDPNFEDFIGSGEIIDCNLTLGEHIIVLEVIDKAGAFDTNEVTIIVQDTTPPDFALSVSPSILWPPNHKMVLITPSWTVSDECDATPEVSLVSIVANEGDDTIGDGHTTDDIQIGEDGAIYLRAERSGTGNDRVYTITYQAVDDCGNASVGSATVSIPHDFKVLARIAARWLWTGPAGRIPEDLNGDGAINFTDFAKFAEN
ncbi:MAG: LamG-like jellyroll fold domain-containing protein, partial [Planctomycetota bacterium]